LLPEIRVGGTRLDARAFAAEAAFVYPEESREIVRSLLRAEITTHEAERLGLQPDPARIQQEMARFESDLAAELGPGADFDAWSRRRYGRRWEEARQVLVAHLARNQLWQICVRAEAHLQPRARLHWLVTPNADEAETWARQLRGGMDPRSLAPASRLPGREADGSFAPCAARLPAPHAAALAGLPVGAVVGPLQFEGDRAWWVGRIAETFLASAQPPPVAVLLAELDAHPLEALEIRAWFEAMLGRYTATDGAPSIAAPLPAFVPDSANTAP